MTHIPARAVFPSHLPLHLLAEMIPAGIQFFWCRRCGCLAIRSALAEQEMYDAIEEAWLS